MVVILFENEEEVVQFTSLLRRSHETLCDCGAVVQVNRDLHSIGLWLVNHTICPWVEMLDKDTDVYGDSVKELDYLKELRRDGEILQKIVDIVFVKGTMTHKEEEELDEPR